GQSGCNTSRQVLASQFRGNRFRTQHFRQIRNIHRDVLRLAFRELQRDLPDHPPQRLLQPPDACFTRVSTDQSFERFVSHLKLLSFNSCLSKLPRQQVAPGDLRLFLFAVSRQPQDLHTIQQRRRNRVQRIRRGDEQHFREIERQ